MTSLLCRRKKAGKRDEKERKHPKNDRVQPSDLAQFRSVSLECNGENRERDLRE